MACHPLPTLNIMMKQLSNSNLIRFASSKILRSQFYPEIERTMDIKEICIANLMFNYSPLRIMMFIKLEIMGDCSIE